MKNVNTEANWNKYHLRPNSPVLNYPEKFKHISQELLKDLPKQSRIIDLGSGMGALLTQLRIDHSEWILEGLDFSQVAVDFLNKIGILGIKGNIPGVLKKLPKYNAVIGTELLEHLEYTERLKTIKYISKLLKKDGIAIFTVPDNVLPPSEESSHFVCYTKETFEKFLKQVFSICKVYSKEYLISNKPNPHPGKCWGYCPFLIGVCKGGKK